MALDLLADVRRIDNQLEELTKHITAAVTASGTTVTDVYGVGPIGAALIVCGAAPGAEVDAGTLYRGGHDIVAVREQDQSFATGAGQATSGRRGALLNE